MRLGRVLYSFCRGLGAGALKPCLIWVDPIGGSLQVCGRLSGHRIYPKDQSVFALDEFSRTQTQPMCDRQIGALNRDFQRKVCDIDHKSPGRRRLLHQWSNKRIVNLKKMRVTSADGRQTMLPCQGDFRKDGSAVTGVPPRRVPCRTGLLRSRPGRVCSAIERRRREGPLHRRRTDPSPVLVAAGPRDAGAGRSAPYVG